MPQPEKSPRATIDESPHFGLNPENWQRNFAGETSPKNLAKVADDVTRFSREARNTSFENRANPVVTSLLDFSKLVKPESNLSTDIATAIIYDWAKKDSPSIKIWTQNSSPTSEEILEAIYPYRDVNPGSIMIWLSPKGKVYVGARTNIYQTIAVNDEKFLFFWAIPSSHSDEEFLEFNRKLIYYTSDKQRAWTIIKDAEDLRINPIPVQIPQFESLTAFLDQNISLSEVWKAIASGKIIMDTLSDLARVKPMVAKRYQEIIRAKTELERIIVGASIEQDLQDEFGALLSDSHGGLYLSLFINPLASGSFLEMAHSPFQREYTSGRRFHCGKCGKTGYLNKGESCSSSLSAD